MFKATPLNLNVHNNVSYFKLPEHQEVKPILTRKKKLPWTVKSRKKNVKSLKMFHLNFRAKIHLILLQRTFHFFLELIEKQFSVFLPKKLEDRIILVSHLLCLNNVSQMWHRYFFLFMNVHMDMRRRRRRWIYSRLLRDMLQLPICISVTTESIWPYIVVKVCVLQGPKNDFFLALLCLLI